MITREDIDKAQYTVRLDENGNRRAYVDVLIDNFIMIKDFTIVANKYGKLYVMNPRKTITAINSETGKTFKKIYGTVSLYDHPLRDYLVNAILNAYGKHFQERNRANNQALKEQDYTYIPKKILKF